MTSLGDGYGRGSSFGFGFGSGYDDGYGVGTGWGDGYGVGTGWGDGYGNSDGYGYGTNDGSGYGGGDDVLVATLGEYEVRAVITPWGRTARVGCQVHDLDVWRERWCAIAQEHGVTVSAEEATQLITLVEEAPLGVEWLPSEEASGG